VVGVLSTKGGLGVSTLAVNLGITLRALTKKEVIVAEYRPGEGSLGLELGYTHPEGLNRLLQRKAASITASDVDRELATHNSGVRLLLASYLPQDARHCVAADSFEAITRHLAEMADFIVLDLGPALPPSTDKVLSLCDEVIVVLEPVPNTIQRTKVFVDVLRDRGFGEGRVNLVLVNRNRSDLQLSWTQVKEQLGKELAVAFTPIPELTYQAAKNNVPVVIMQPESLTGQQFSKLADLVSKHARQKA
jgi:pilus assembly protein CpaE